MNDCRRGVEGIIGMSGREEPNAYVLVHASNNLLAIHPIASSIHASPGVPLFAKYVISGVEYDVTLQPSSH